MGLCFSLESTAVVPLATAKLVLQDGTLQEFSAPVKASHALGNDGRTCFVCSADDMEFDSPVSALGAGEELQLGQLYFVLPRSMLKRRLQPDDMAALAIRASAALVRMAGEEKGRRRRPQPVPLVFPPAEKKRGSGRSRSSPSKLSAIPE